MLVNLYSEMMEGGIYQVLKFWNDQTPVQDNKFVRESAKFSNQSTAFRDAFNGFSPRPEKGISCIVFRWYLLFSGCIKSFVPKL